MRSRNCFLTLLLLSAMHLRAAGQGDWSEPAVVRYDDNVCLSYRARVQGDYVMVRVAIEPGWHTFAMDNQQRASEKLAGKKALAIDRATEIRLDGALKAVGPWFQSPPKDFSKPELRIFTWGFEESALFAVKVQRSGAGPARLAVKGQACTDAICKNIDIAMTVQAVGSSVGSGKPLDGLIPVQAP